MKKILLGASVAIAALGMASCSEDFEVAAPYKDVTIVYGLLNMDDGVNYIRIQKAFLSQDVSAIEMAKSYDSSFYNNIDVFVKEIGTSGNEVSVTQISLDTLAPKQSGVFFNAPNTVYAYHQSINPNYRYRLVIKHKNSGAVDSAITSIVSTYNTNGTFRVDEFDNGTNPPVSFFFNSDKSAYSLTCRTSNSPAYYFESYIRFKYWDEDVDTSFDWRFAYTTTQAGNTFVKLSTNTSSFLPAFKAYIPEATNSQKRYIDSADVYVWAAESNYYHYLVANTVQGGLTADQISPVFSTIHGENTIGVFGSRGMRIRTKVPLDDRSVDTLMNNYQTRLLNFVGRKK